MRRDGRGVDQAARSAHKVGDVATRLPKPCMRRHGAVARGRRHRLGLLRSAEGSIDASPRSHGRCSTWMNGSRRPGFRFILGGCIIVRISSEPSLCVHIGGRGARRVVVEKVA